MQWYVLLMAGLGVCALFWHHGYRRGKSDAEQSFMREYGERIRNSYSRD